MTQIFGSFIEKGDDQEYLIIGFSPSSLPLQQRWRNNGLSADFLADYLTTFFPAHDESSSHRQAEIKNAVSYIANELLENAMKFSHTSFNYPVSIGLYLHHNKIRFYVTNSVNPDIIARFQTFIQRLLTEDTDELYIRQIEENANGHANNGSHLGFLTMINDYEASLAWKFDKIEAEQDSKVFIVTTMVQLMV